MGTQLHLIAPLLSECLAVPKVDPEVKLKIFTALSTVLLQRDTSFRKCEPDKLETCLRIVTQGIYFEMIQRNLFLRK